MATSTNSRQVSKPAKRTKVPAVCVRCQRPLAYDDPKAVTHEGTVCQSCLYVEAMER